MTSSRHFSLATRSSVLMTTGLALIAAPFALELTSAALVTGVGIGVLMVALGLAGTDPSGRGSLPVSAQAEYDRGIGFGLVLVGVVFGLADEGTAGLVFGIAGVAALLVTALTRYTTRPA
ncbi:MAG: hypothetical protein ACRDM7_00580 [Thermoleophilaceae bacterium]